MGHPDELVGTWELVSAEFRDEAGELSYPWGADPIGVVTYSATGHMSVQLMRSDRPRFAANDPTAGSPEEILAAFAGIITYFGSYEVEGPTVTHELEGCSFPNWEGTELSRTYAVEGDTLTLTTAPMRVGGADVVGVLAWQRVEQRQEGTHE